MTARAASSRADGVTAALDDASTGRAAPAPPRHRAPAHRAGAALTIDDKRAIIEQIAGAESGSDRYGAINADGEFKGRFGPRPIPRTSAITSACRSASIAVHAGVRLTSAACWR